MGGTATEQNNRTPPATQLQSLAEGLEDQEGPRAPGDMARCCPAVAWLCSVGAGTAAFALAPALPWHGQWLEEGPGCHNPLVPRELWQKLSNSGKGCAGPTGAALVPSAPAAVSAREQLELLHLTAGCSAGLSQLLLPPWL